MSIAEKKINKGRSVPLRRFRRRLATENPEETARIAKEEGARLVAIEKERFLLALESRLGVIHFACKATGISRCKFAIWVENDPEFEAAVRQVEVTQFEFVEMKLLECIKNNDTKAIIYYMATKGANRGYGSPYARARLEDQAPPQPLLPESSEILQDRTEMDDTALGKALKIAMDRMPNLFNGHREAIHDTNGKEVIEIQEQPEDDSE